MILCLLALGIMDSKRNDLLSYRIHNRIKRLNHPNIIKMWAIIQAIIVFLKIGNSLEEWIITLLIPIIITTLVLINGILFTDPAKEEKIDKDDFKSYKRNHKINKIIR